MVFTDQSIDEIMAARTAKVDIQPPVLRAVLSLSGLHRLANTQVKL